MSKVAGAQGKCVEGAENGVFFAPLTTPNWGPNTLAPCASRLWSVIGARPKNCGAVWPHNLRSSLPGSRRLLFFSSPLEPRHPPREVGQVVIVAPPKDRLAEAGAAAHQAGL
jgi:hypothetical protein